MENKKQTYGNMIKTKNIYRHNKYRDDQIFSINNCKTMPDLFYNAVKKNWDKDFLGTIVNNKIHYVEYYNIYNRAREFANHLNKIKCDNNIIGIYSNNRAEWMICEQAIYMCNYITCPLYATFGIPAINYIFEETEMDTIYVSGEKLESIKELIETDSYKKNIKNLICFDEVSFEIAEYFKNKNITLFEVPKSYKKYKLEKISKMKPSDLATICYTSGTSGIPKGVMLTHQNLTSTVSCVVKYREEFLFFDINAIYISYLPMAHVMERVSIQVVVALGAKIGFYRGNPKLLQEDLKIIQPTFIAGVPRVFNLFKQRIEAGIEKKNFFIRWIVKLALKYKICQQKSGNYKSPLLDWLIFGKIQKEFGGNLEMGVSASAPLNPEVCSYLQGIFSMKILEVYGATETSAPNIVKPYSLHICGTVGIPIPLNKIKILKTMDDHTDAYGEICVKGSNVFTGYYKNEEKTTEVLKNGWYRTGDIGIVENGLFNIYSREKDIFKTSLGEYIVPDKIENVFCEIVEDIFITSEKYSDVICAIVVSNKPEQEVKDMIYNYGMMKVKEGILAKFEIPRYIKVIDTNFRDMDLLTPTAKKQRKIMQAYFEGDIRELYQNK